MQKHGFTLIELSVVLVIVALLVAGIVGGKEMIENAGVRRQVSEWENFNTKVGAFRSKYNCIPGDCVDGTKFFPATQPWCPTLVGDGNGLINYATSAYGCEERALVFYHLYHAGMESTVTGIYSAAITAGVTIPKTKLGNGNAFWILSSTCTTSYNAACTGSTFMPPGNYIFTGQPILAIWGTEIRASNYDPSDGAWGELNGSSFTPAQAQNIDAKLDDGRPLTGKVTSHRATAGHPYYLTNYDVAGSGYCTNASGNYNISIGTFSCALAIKTPY